MPWLLPVPDHGELTGLGDDDHSQYLTVTRHEGEHSSGRWERATGQSIAQNSNVTVIWNNAIYEDDPDGDFTMNTSTGVLTINTAGVYLIGTGVDWASNNTGTRLVYILHDGITRLASIRSPGSDSSQELALCTLFDCAATDTIEVQVRQSTTGALDVDATASSNFWIRKL